jgi:hypothetical protein
MPEYPEYRPGDPYYERAPPPAPTTTTAPGESFRNPVYNAPPVGAQPQYGGGGYGRGVGFRNFFTPEAVFSVAVLSAVAFLVLLVASLFVDSAGGFRALRFFGGLALLVLAISLIGGGAFANRVPDLVRAGMLVAGSLLLAVFAWTMFDAWGIPQTGTEGFNDGVGVGNT